MKSRIYGSLVWIVVLLALSSSVNAQGLISHDFDDGDMGPFVQATTQSPNYAKPVNGRLRTYWIESSYNGTRMTKGAEIAGDPSINGIGYLTIKHCWLGFTIHIDEGYMAGNTNTVGGLMQIFGFDESLGYSSWTAMLEFDSGDLTWIDRRNMGASRVEVVVYEDFPKGVDVDIIVHAVLSAEDKGQVEIFVNGIKKYSDYNISIGMGEFNSNDEQDWDSYTEFKIGQYNHHTSGYVTDEVRIIDYDNISWYDGEDGYSIVNPAVQYIRILGNGIAINAGDMDPESANGTDFGITTGSVARTFSITNQSESVTLNLTGSPNVTVTSPGGHFIRSQDASTNALAPHNATSFEVTYAPQSGGVHTALVSVASSDVALPLYTFGIVGIRPGAPTVATQHSVAKTVTSATLSGGLMSGSGVADAWICWGETDGGTTSTGDWAHVISVGSVTEGIAFSNLVTDLSTNTTYFYRCYVENTYGSDWSDTTEMFSGTPVGKQPWTPAELTLAAWYDAADTNTITESGGAVSLWNDKSENGKHATQGAASARPASGAVTIGGVNAISFDGVDDRLVNASFSLPPEICISLVGRIPNTETSDFNGILGSVSAFSQNRGGGQYFKWGTSTAPTIGNADTSYDSFMTTLDDSSGGITSYFNGSPNDTSTYQDPSSDTKFVVGARPDETYFCEVYIGEIVYYPKGVANIEKVQGYLAHKWGLTANLPIGHPYKDASPTGLGVLANLSPTGISDSAVTFNASLDASGTNYDVYVYYGTSDGGTNAAAWDASLPVGSWTNVTTNIYHSLNSLLGDTRYVYTFMVSNAAETVWASPSWTFGTLRAAIPPVVTTNYAVPHAWLSAQNASWSNDYEAAVLADPDGDGFSTWQEYWSGTDPQDSNSYFRLDSIVSLGSNVVLEWRHAQVDTGIPPICIQINTNLFSGTWEYAGEQVPVDGTSRWTNAPESRAFYRICVTNVP